MPSLCKHHLDTADAKRPKHHLDTSRKPPKPQAKKLFHVTFGIHNLKQPKAKTIFGATEHMPSLCKHHLDTADAKRPKHHLDTSRKPPKPQAKKLFHVTFGIHIKLKQSLEPQSTCPAYANTIWNHIKQLWSHRAHAQPMQTPSSTADAKRPKHHLDTSRKPPKPQAKKLFHVTFGIHIKLIFGATEHMPSLCKHHVDTADAKRLKHISTSRSFTSPLEHIKQFFGATEHMPSLCKHHLDTADAKRPKHHLDTSRKPPKPQAKKLFHVTFGIHINKTTKTSQTIFGATEHMPSLCKHHLDTADAKRPKHHLDTSRKPPKPQAKKLFHVTFGIHIKQSLEPQSTCPAYANTIWTLQMQKDPNTIWTRAENRPNRKPKNCFTSPLEAT